MKEDNGLVVLGDACARCRKIINEGCQQQLYISLGFCRDCMMEMLRQADHLSLEMQFFIHNWVAQHRSFLGMFVGNDPRKMSLLHKGNITDKCNYVPVTYRVVEEGEYGRGSD